MPKLVLVGVLSLSLVLVAAACGGGGSGSSASPRPTTRSAPGALPVDWKRCTNVRHGFSVGYPGSWHVASYGRLDVLGRGDAYRKKFFERISCLHYDPRPFTVHDATEGPTTAVSVFHFDNAREYRREMRAWFHAPYVRTILQRRAVVAGHPAIRFHVYLRRGAPLWDRSHVYGYLVGFGHRGGLLIEAWRYGFSPIAWKQYRLHMALVDRMAPTLRIGGSS